MVQKSILYYDPTVGEEYIRSNIAGSIVSPYQRDIIRSINVLSEFQQKGTISKRHCNPVKHELYGQIGQLMDRFLLHLKSLWRCETTISDHRLYLSRFLTYLNSRGISAIEEVRQEHLLSFVSTQTNNQIGIVSIHLQNIRGTGKKN